MRDPITRWRSALLSTISLNRPDVDADKISLIGQSMGGYYGGRGAAKEPRLRAAILWGACYDLTEDIYDFWPAVRSQVEWVIGARGRDGGAREAQGIHA